MASGSNQRSAVAHPYIYGSCACAPVAWHRLDRRLASACGLMIACLPAHAQHANQPGYDPRQTEKRFEDQQSSQGANGRPRLPLPQFARPEGQGDSKPLFVLRHVSISGAVAIPQDRLVTTYQPYIGKKVSQADLAAIAAAVSDVYRAAGFHLSRAIVPPQDIQGGAASHSGHRRQHHGAGAEGRRRRAVRRPADARCRAGRAALAACDARTAIAADQRPARRTDRGHRDRGDRHRERRIFA